jgi:hypothetical protein
MTITETRDYNSKLAFVSRRERLLKIFLKLSAMKNVVTVFNTRGYRDFDTFSLRIFHEEFGPTSLITWSAQVHYHQLGLGHFFDCVS